MLRFRELLAGFVVGEPLSPACRDCGSATVLVRDEAIGGYPPLLDMEYRCPCCGDTLHRFRVCTTLD